MEYVLQTHALTKTYKKVNAVDNVNMRIPEGSIYGFVGRNGSGKTTLIRMVTGLINPTSGDFSLYGATLKPELSVARRRIAAVIETPSIYLNMTAHENLALQCKLLGIDESIIESTLKTVGLDNTGNKKSKNFSLGMKQRLGIGLALVGSPDFLLLDEPTNGLDPEGIIEIRELLIRLNRESNITVLISSHILGELSKIATHYGFINKGKLIKEYSSKELLDQCRKRIKVNVGSTKEIPTIMPKFKGVTDYKIISNTEIDIFGEIDITELVIQLKALGTPILKITEQNEDLESFYINLVGGSN